MQSKNSKKIIIIVFALIAIASGFYFAFRKGKGVEAAWYGDSWLYRKKITIDHTKVKGKLNNFPVLASTTDSSLASFAQADGDDILFTSSDGRTKLNHEIEKYDSTTGQLVSWVQAGLSSTTDTVLYMYYGNSSCGEQSTSTLVWDSNYKGVWHLKETDIDGGAGDIKDSTSNDNNGTTYTMDTTDQVGGEIDGSFDFDGASDYVDAGDPTSGVLDMGTSDMTLSAWINPDNANGQIINKRNYAGEVGYDFYYIQATQLVMARIGDGSSELTALSANNSVLPSQWSHVTAVYDRDGNLTIYVNGISSGTPTNISSKSATQSNSHNFTIGDRNQTSYHSYFNGIIDEPRISSSARSADWIATEYNNQSSPSTFMTWGDHQSKTALYGAGGLPPILYLKFNEGYGTVAYDSSDYGNDATITGPTWKNEVFCKTGKCLDFDGANDYLIRAYDTDFNFSTSSFSLNTWFLTNTVSASSTLASRYDSAGWKLWMDADGDLCFGIDDDATWGGATPDDSACTTDKNYDDNTWHHLTAYRDSTTGIYLYADGQQVASDTALSATNSLSGTSPALYLGVENNGTSSPFTGRLDDFKIYGYARNATQIASDYGVPGTIRGASVSLGSRATTTTSGAPDLTTGLVGYWDFDLATSTDKVVDLSGNESYGILGGGTAAYTPNWVEQGKKGKALKFDGVDDYVDAGTTPQLNGVTLFTVGAWVKPLLNKSTNNFLQRGSSWFSNGYFYLWSDNNGTVTFDTEDNITLAHKLAYGSFNLVPGQWYYVVGVVKSNELQVYINGVSGAPTAFNGAYPLVTGSTINYRKFFIGNQLYNDTTKYPFNGTIDDVRIYNRTLSPREISWLYNQGKPLAEWHFRNNYNDTGSWCENNPGTSECKNLTAAGTGNTFATSTLELEASSLRLNGSGYATIADDVSLDVATGTDFSLTTTFMTTDTGNVVLAAKRNTDSGAGYLLGLDYGLGDGKVFFEVGDGTDEFQIQGATNLADGAWHTVTVVFDDDSTTGNKIYVDGRDDTASTSGTLINVGPLSNALAFVVGAESDGGAAINAKIDRVAFYGYALASDDVKKEVLGTKAIKIGQHVADSQGSDPLGGKLPVGWWKLNERSGTTAADYASSTLNGTWNGTGNHFVPGKIGYAGQFNGSSDYVSVPDSNNISFSDRSFSLEAWINFNNLNSRYIISKYNSAGHINYGFYFASDVLYTGVHYYSDLFYSFSPTLNQWYYLVETFENSTKKLTLYIDGIPVKNTTIGEATTITANPFVIGSRSAYDIFFGGKIDNVKIYDYARSAAQVAWDYNQGAPRAHWKFDEGTGSTTQDASENNYDGTITGATWSTSGKVHNALSFDGSGDEVSTADVQIASPSTYDEVSFGAWVNPSTSIASKAILVKNTEFRLVTDSTGRALCQIHNGTDWQTAATSTNPLSLGTWQHVMCYYDKTNIKLYLNGQEDDSTALTQSVNNSSVIFEVGDDVGGIYGDYQGLIDDVRIYNYARPAAFILQDYNNGMSARF